MLQFSTIILSETAIFQRYFFAIKLFYVREMYVGSCIWTPVWSLCYPIFHIETNRPNTTPFYKYFLEKNKIILAKLVNILLYKTRLPCGRLADEKNYVSETCKYWII